MANEAVWVASITWVIPNPMANISSRAHHKLEWAPSRVISAIAVAMQLRPAALCLPGTERG